MRQAFLMIPCTTSVKSRPAFHEYGVYNNAGAHNDHNDDAGKPVSACRLKAIPKNIEPILANCVSRKQMTA